jgi:hypothetical protein
MSTFGRSIIFLMIFPSSAVYSSPSSAQPGKDQSQTPALTGRTRMDGKFGHYLVTPTGLSSPTGPVLLNASVEKRSGVAGVAGAAAKTTAPATTGTGSPPSSHRGRKRGLSPSKGLVPSEDRNANGSFFFGNTNISARGKRPEGIWLKLKHMTTGTDHVGDDPRWQRSEETSGP